MGTDVVWDYNKLDALWATSWDGPSAPRANVFFRLASDAWHTSPQASALTHLMVKLVDDALNEDAYLADVACLAYGISPDGTSGVEIKIDGFSHKLPLLVQRVFSTLVSATFDPTSFANVKEALLRKYRNVNMTVGKHAAYNRLYMLCNRAWHVDEVLPEMEKLELADFKPFMATVLGRVKMKVGNHAAYNRLCMLCNRAWHVNKVLPEMEKLELADFKPFMATVLGRQHVRNVEEENVAYESYFQCISGAEASNRALVDIVDQVVSEPCYNQLRTKEQLGYTVHSGVRMTHGILGFCFTVQSAKFPAEHVDASVETFIQGFYDDKLKAITADEFEKQKGSVVSSKLQRDRSLHDESIRHWDSIWNQNFRVGLAGRGGVGVGGGFGDSGTQPERLNLDG
eukprot:gene21126-28013_t